MADIYGRPILPQAAFSWQPPMTDRQPKQTNYVFVDEHNRSRRLKVMRACENCRKRKIKCDAATTNSWPCGACMKQRLQCAPPVLNLEKGEIPELSTRETPIKKEDNFPKPVQAKVQTFRANPAAQPQTSAPYQPQGIKSNTTYTTSEPATSSVYQDETYTDISFPQSYDQIPTPPNPQPQAAHSIYEQSNTGNSMSPTRSASVWSETPETDLQETMKELNISDVGLAPYINNQKNLADKAAVHDTELSIPIPASPDGQVRIPDSMMPSDKQAMIYFDYFFENVHPYLPVLNKESFLHQWAVDKQSISPLILEAIFAISTQLLHPSQETNQWLALAAHHEKAFDDVSRLSTVQGLLLLLKARESVPKRGYYWRSWMQIVKIVHMGKDLELGQHLELHEDGKHCGCSKVECHTKTRTWQAAFVLELMIGGPQGRTYSVPLDTVNFEFPDELNYKLGDQEEQISRQFTLFAKAIKNVRYSLAKYAELRKLKTDWAMDERFQGYNKVYDGWLRDLPDQFQIYFPQDSSTPQIPSHFIANMHSYYYLSIVMHHRPQLQAAQTKGAYVFMSQLVICYTAATRLCRLQEAILEEYGLEGLLWMLRGVNFGIYAVITSTMLHLVALTCPDPTLNYDAMDYFPRHMRILERCTENWSMSEIQSQVQSLREAFSADPTKPFELRSDFPRVDSSKGSPKSDSDVAQMQHYASVESSSQAQFSNMPMQQPIFQGVRRQSDVGTTAVPQQEQFMMNYGSDFADYAAQSSHHYDNWDPSKISALWNTAFEPPAAAYEQGSPSQQGTGTTPPAFPPQFTQNVTNVTNVQYNTYTNPQFPGSGTGDGPSPSAQWSTYQAPQMQTFVAPGQQPQPQPQQGSQTSAPVYTPFSTPASITPGMWQDAVASSYGLGSKRHFSDASESQVPSQKRAR